MKSPTKSTQCTPHHARSGNGRVLAALCKGTVLFLSLAAIAAVAHYYDLAKITDPPVWVQTHLGGQGGDQSTSILRPVILFLFLAAVLSPLGIPRQAISLLGGYAFGALTGALAALAGLTLGCACGFLYARFFARNLLRRRFGARIQKLDAFLCHNPFAMALTIRLFPMGNNALTSMAAGVTNIPALPFIAGSSLGYVPQTVVFALLGSGFHIDGPWRIALSALLFALASLLGYRLYRRFKERGTLHDEATPEGGQGETA